eukprot:TRINITY_DN16618_c0_g1_i1.p2 TRINITY_DN16618_c0_g1~~TRINITY_DN16618_c0_g1_i1.p2  ORF type:complete len:112 (+),score=19.17 TRINITY_DN16618_c0_g1_i1:58-393(+)
MATWSTGTVIPITTTDEVQRLKKFMASTGNQILVKYSAGWAAPCQSMSDHFQLLAKGSTKTVLFTVDVDAVPAYANACGIEALPTFILYQNGSKLREVRGADADRVSELVS